MILCTWKSYIAESQRNVLHMRVSIYREIYAEIKN